jgi:NadR type nicotinamide-nucleotide adenylyltransferase
LVKNVACCKTSVCNRQRIDKIGKVWIIKVIRRHLVNVKTGFTLGKYAPFHKGHEYVIATALKEVDHVIVIIYNASLVTNIPTRRRADWIHGIFPEVEIIIAEDGPQETGYTPEIIEKQNKYLKKLLEGRNIHSFYSSEEYGYYISKALQCDNRIVDLKRETVPINATKIREIKNIRTIKDFVSKCVYDDIKPKYYFIGAPSTRKTTLSKKCASVFYGSYCKEYGRDYWFKFQKDHRLSMRDLENIAIGHNNLEDTVCAQDKDCVFIDTNVITTFSYALYYFGKASSVLIDILQSSLYKYTHLFLCDEDIPFDDTWDRSGPKSRAEIQNITKTVLEQNRLNYVAVSGSLEKRLEKIKTYIQKEIV